MATGLPYTADLVSTFAPRTKPLLSGKTTCIRLATNGAAMSHSSDQYDFFNCQIPPMVYPFLPEEKGKRLLAPPLPENFCPVLSHLSPTTTRTKHLVEELHILDQQQVVWRQRIQVIRITGHNCDGPIIHYTLNLTH